MEKLSKRNKNNALSRWNSVISNEKLIEGRWNVKIEWTVNNNTYLFKEKIMY